MILFNLVGFSVVAVFYIKMMIEDKTEKKK